VTEAIKQQLEPNFDIRGWKHERTESDDVTGDVLKQEDSLWFEHERRVPHSFSQPSFI